MDQTDLYVLRDDDDLDSYYARVKSPQSTETAPVTQTSPYALRDDDDLDSYFERVKAEDARPAPEGTLSQMGSQFVAGATDLKKMAGQAVQAFTPEDSAPYQWGGEVAENAEKAAEEYEPDLRDKNEVQKALIRGARAIVPSVASLPAYAAGPVAGAAATTALFGGSQFQDTKERLLAEGVPEDEATKAALLTGAIQGGGEAAANKLTLGLFGAGKKAAAAGIKGLTSEATDQAILKPFAKSFGAAAIGEPATEITQDVGTEAVERAYTGKPFRDYGDIAYESGTTALAMTAILGPFGAGGHYANSRIAKRINTALDDPTVPAEKRQVEVDRIHARAKNAGVQDADAWREQALADIANGAPIRREVVPPGEVDGQNTSATGPGQSGTPIPGAPTTEDDAGTATGGTEPPTAVGQPGGRTATGVPGEPNPAENAGAELANENADLGGPALAETKQRTRDFVARVGKQFPDLSKLRMGKNMRDALAANGIDPTQETPQSGFEKLSAIANTKTEEELKQEKAAKLAESGPIGRAAGASVMSGAADRAQAEQQAQTEAEAQKETNKIAVNDEEAAGPVSVEPAEQGPEPYSPEALAAIPDKELGVLFRNASKLSDGEQRKAIREAINAERNRRIESQEPEVPVAPGGPNAEAIRSNQGQPGQTGEIREESEVDSGGDLYQPEPGPEQGGEGTALGQRNTQPEEPEAPVPQAVTQEARPEAVTPAEETPLSTEATPPPGPISDESQNQAAQERPLEAEAQKVEPKRIAQIQSVIAKLDAKVAEKGSMGLNFVTAPLRKAATDLGVYDENATPDQTVANIRAKLTELTPPAPEVVGKGRSGDVVRIGNEVEKNALNDEGKLYSMLADKEGIAKGYEKEGKVRLPYYKHVISVDTIAPEKRAQLRGLVTKNAPRINRAVSELTNTGYSYNDPLQFGMDEGKKFDLLDFSNAQKSDTALNENLSMLANFYREFGAKQTGDAVSQVNNVLRAQHFTDKWGNKPRFAEKTDPTDYEAITQALGGPATNAYFTALDKPIAIQDAAQTDIINGVKTVLTIRPLTEQEIGEWELTPVVENLKLGGEVSDKEKAKTETEKTETAQPISNGGIARRSAPLENGGTGALRGGVPEQEQSARPRANLSDTGSDVSELIHTNNIRTPTKNKPQSTRQELAEAEKIFKGSYYGLKPKNALAKVLHALDVFDRDYNNQESVNRYIELKRIAESYKNKLGISDNQPQKEQQDISAKKPILGYADLVTIQKNAYSRNKPKEFIPNLLRRTAPDDLAFGRPGKDNPEDVSYVYSELTRVYDGTGSTKESRKIAEALDRDNLVVGKVVDQSNGNNFAVIDRDTGSAIGGFAKTRKGAIEVFVSKVNSHGIDKTKELFDKNRALNSGFFQSVLDKYGQKTQTQGQEKNAEESDAQFSAQPQEHPVDAAGKLVVTHPENGQTAPKNDILNGNYAKAPVMFGDLPVAIENGVGSVREGVDKDGRNWKQELKDNYGEITGVQGADKDHIDVFIKPQLTKEAIDKTDTVYIVDQIDTKSDPNAPKFDESKIMMGYGSLPEAKAAYFRNYEDGWKGMGAITPVKMADFKNWLKSGKTTQQFAPTLKAQGAQEAQNLNPANIRDEIMPIFTNLENAQPKAVRKAAMEQIAAHPLAERLQYVQDNFYDLLLDLEQNGKVDIKC